MMCPWRSKVYCSGFIQLLPRFSQSAPPRTAGSWAVTVVWVVPAGRCGGCRPSGADHSLPDKAILVSFSRCFHQWRVCPQSFGPDEQLKENIHMQLLLDFLLFFLPSLASPSLPLPHPSPVIGQYTMPALSLLPNTLSRSLSPPPHSYFLTSSWELLTPLVAF